MIYYELLLLCTLDYSDLFANSNAYCFYDAFSAIPCMAVVLKRDLLISLLYASIGSSNKIFHTYFNAAQQSY